MKILPLVKEVQNDIASSGIRLKQATTEGYKVANRTSQIYKQGNVKKLINIARSVSSKVAQGTTTKELPYLAGAIGMFIPIPFASPILMGLGFLARFSSTGASIMYKNRSDAHVHLDTKA